MEELLFISVIIFMVSSSGNEFYVKQQAFKKNVKFELKIFDKV